ncbi:hypothetical protein K466DRAFT_42977 [Polyporus arcularius HHB13444]|uniref:Uncharacterized protein n=1 Tax=Polyporus arcularius HHB13444 TaxID=1314778 RepID=A0A5C3NQJ5_9APHY|nr:hypothetical protein K466DRAFT_42977 [Polyporus arcularius HHB13444]
MLTDSQLHALQIALENAHEGHGLLDRERLPRTMEDQLAVELITINNKHILRAASGKDRQRANESELFVHHVAVSARRPGYKISRRSSAGTQRASAETESALRTPSPRVQGLEEKLSWDKAYARLIKRDAADDLRQSRTGCTKRGTNTCSPSSFLRELTTTKTRSAM